MRQTARARGYLVMAVSGGAGKKSCWHKSRDAHRVAAALRYVVRVEKLQPSAPVFAMGASSGGAFVGALAAPVAYGGLPGLRCIVSEIMGLKGAVNRGVPTFYVHMPLDRFTAIAVRKDLERLRQQRVISAEIEVAPLPVTTTLLQRCLAPNVADDVVQALKATELLDPQGYLKWDSRERRWAKVVRVALRGRSNDTLRPDESCLSEEMNVAWAKHEFTAQYAAEMIDFCEGSVGSTVTLPLAGRDKGDEPHRKTSALLSFVKALVAAVGCCMVTAACYCMLCRSESDTRSAVIGGAPTSIGAATDGPAE